MNIKNQTNMDTRLTIVELLTESIIEIFSEFELNLSVIDGEQKIPKDGICLIALIGLSADLIRMSLLL